MLHAAEPTPSGCYSAGANRPSGEVIIVAWRTGRSRDLRKEGTSRVASKQRSIESTLVEAPGALQIRSGGVGCLEYTVLNINYALLEDAREGLGQRKTLSARRSAGDTRRAAVVHALRCIGQMARGCACRRERPSMCFPGQTRSSCYLRAVPEAARETVAIHIA